MAAQIILIEASPAQVADGSAVSVRLAGGGALKPYDYGGYSDWRSGIVGLPTLIADLAYDGGEFPDGSVPGALSFEWAPSNKAALSQLAGYLWKDAAITVRIGAEGAYPAVRISGKVLDATAVDGKLTIAMADPAAGLKKPLLTSRYAGTGGLEGPAEWEGVIKRRIWGRIWNLRGEPIDKANNIYCYADPGQKLQAIDAVRDKGAPAASLTTVAWQGTAAATLAALQAAAAPQGGGVVCPSIACVKWWTQPAGDLCADLKGEIGAGYVETTAEIAERLVQLLGGPAMTAGTVAAAAASRPAPVGWLANDDNTTVQAMLDEFLGNSSLLWLLEPAGTITMRPWAWGASVASATSQDVSRKKVLPPLGTRKLGYRRNEQKMGRGDLAAIVLATEVTFLDGSTAQDNQPADPGATRNTTSFNIDWVAADIDRLTAVGAQTATSTITTDADGKARLVVNTAPAATIAGTYSVTSTRSGLTAPTSAIMGDTTYDDAAHVWGSNSETDPAITLDFGSSKPVGLVYYAAIKGQNAGGTGVAGPGAVVIPAVMRASSNYAGKSPGTNASPSIMTSAGACMRDGLAAAYANIYATNSDSPSYYEMEFSADTWVKSIAVRSVDSGNPTGDGWGPSWSDGLTVKTSTLAGSYGSSLGSLGTFASGVANTMNIAATVGKIRVEKSGWSSIGEFIAYDGGWGISFLNSAALQGWNGSAWVTITTISGVADGALSYFDVAGTSYSKLRIINSGAAKSLGVGAFYAQSPAAGGTIELEGPDIAVEAGVNYALSFEGKTAGSTANVDVGISAIDGAGNKTFIKFTASALALTTTAATTTGYLKAASGSAVEPANNMRSPSLLPAGTVKMRVRFKAASGARIGPISLQRVVGEVSSQAGADVTADQQVSVEIVTDKSIAADYTGALTGSLADVVWAPKVVRGGVSIKGDNNTTYAITNVYGCGTTSDIVVDNTNGSSTKGNVTFAGGATMTALNAGCDLTISVNGVAQPKIALKLSKNVASPPPTTGGGSGTYPKSVSWTTGDYTAVSSSSYVQAVSAIRTITLAAGEKIYASGGLGFTVAGSGAAFRNMTLVVRYAVHGSGSWNDLAVAVDGTGGYSGASTGPPSYDFEPGIDGSVTIAQSKSGLSAADYDVALYAKDSATGRLCLLYGDLFIEAKP